MTWTPLGFLHPLIQLMYGIEWEQPAIVAEGLAQAAVHQDRLGSFLTKAEEAAARAEHAGETSLPELFEQIRHVEKLATSVSWEDANKINDGVLVRTPDDAIDFLGQIKVKPEEIDERTAEMLHTAVYVAAAAAFHPPHIPKFDFFLM